LCLVASGTDVFAGTVYRSVLRFTDNDKKWSAVNSGLPRVRTIVGSPIGTYIECLAVSETYIFAATLEGIVWRLPLKDLPAK
jgi:hypothetical protein